MNSKTAIVAAVLATSLNPVLAAPNHDHAPPPQAKVFGVGAPLTVDDLPPGRAQDRLQTLPPAARQRALQWMQRFSFPEADLEFLHFDDQGAVLYVDPAEGDFDSGEAEPMLDEGPDVAAMLAGDVFALHSKPGAAKVVFLDFDGHEISGTGWNNGTAEVLYAQPFNLDGDAASFSDDERLKIQEIWHRVAEDYAPFDIDVTTEDPGLVDQTHGHILVTRNTDALGVAMPYSTAGGVAYIGVFGNSNYATYAPALVYFNNLASNPPYIAEAATHEFGHNLGLSHDGRVDPYNEAYYYGHGSGYVSWAPIMGVGYNRNVTQWSRGEYAYANNTQDDIGLLGIKLGIRADDHGDALSSATPLVVEVDGSVLVTNPETEDSAFPSPQNKGVIETADDVDVFVFNAGAGTVALNVEPAWAAFYRDTRRGSNLDVAVTLYDEAGQAVASADPGDETSATLSVSVSGGTYYLAIGGVENTVSPYPAYGSLGQYFISGQVVPGEQGSAPEAPILLNATLPSNDTSQLSWIDASSDESGFRVERSLDQANWSVLSTVPADSVSFSDPTLVESTRYYYRVAAYNSFGANYSGMVSVLTGAKPPAATTGVTTTVISSSQIDVSWLDNADDEEGYRLERSTDQSSWTVAADLPANSARYADTGLLPSTTYYYRVVVVKGEHNVISDVVSATTHAQAVLPAAPSAVTATDGQDGTAIIRWVDNSNNEQGFEVRYAKLHPKRGVWQGESVIATTAANSGELVDDSGDGTFRYSVRAFNASGASAWSAWAEVTVTSGSAGPDNPKTKCHPKKGC